MVFRVGIQRPAVEESRALSEVVTAFVRRQIQNADAGRARSERLPARRFTGIRSLHYPATAQGAIKDVVFPGRRSLGAQAAELAAVVQNRERLGGSVVQGKTLKV